MPHNRKVRLAAAALLVASFIPSMASAQEPQQAQRGRLMWPTIAASTAATADWITTYHAIKYYRVQEQNPLLRPFQAKPGGMVSLGGVMDVAGMSAWNMTIGPKHPKLAAAGLWTMTAFRVYLAIHNHMNEHRAEPR